MNMNLPIRDFEFFGPEHTIGVDNEHMLFADAEGRQCKILLSAVKDAAAARSLLMNFFGLSPYKCIHSTAHILDSDNIDSFFAAQQLYKKYPREVIYHFEPQKLTFKELRKNLETKYVEQVWSVNDFLLTHFNLRFLESILLIKNYKAVDFFNFEALEQELEINGLFKFIKTPHCAYVLKLK